MATQKKKNNKTDKFTWKKGDVQIYTEAELKKAGIKIVPPKSTSKKKAK